jgi:hypothetical protein
MEHYSEQHGGRWTPHTVTLAEPFVKDMGRGQMGGKFTAGGGGGGCGLFCGQRDGCSMVLSPRLRSDFLF